MENRTLKEIQDQICALQKVENELLREEYLRHQEASRVHIGRCFRRSDGQYVVVVDVPQQKHHMCGIDYNPYQFPGIAIVDGTIPFTDTHIFSGVWEGDYHPAVTGKYTEITREEFLGVFEARIQEIREMIYKTLSIEYPGT